MKHQTQFNQFSNLYFKKSSKKSWLKIIFIYIKDKKKLSRLKFLHSQGNKTVYFFHKNKKFIKIKP